MARSSRLSVCLAITMRNSSKIHCARSISRNAPRRGLPESATLDHAGDGLALDVVELGRLPGDFPFSRPSGPRSLKCNTQSRMI